MKMIARLAGILALPLFALPASAQEDCDDWNTRGFVANATVETVAACLEAGADANARTDSTFDGFSFSGVFGRYTPLHFATIYSWDGMVTVLLAAGAEVDVRNLQGETPLHWAAGRNRNPAVPGSSLLLSRPGPTWMRMTGPAKHRCTGRSSGRGPPT